MSTLLVKTAGPENIGKVIAIVTTPMIFGPIFGPVLGGLLIEFSSWQWLFFINVGVVALAIPLLIRNLPDFPAVDASRKLDIIGILLLSGMSIAMIMGISKAADSASFLTPSTLLWLAIGGDCYSPTSSMTDTVRIRPFCRCASFTIAPSKRQVSVSFLLTLPLWGQCSYFL